MAKIPPGLIGTLAPLLADAYTHAELNSLFQAARFPGDPPEGNKVHKCQRWMREANRVSEDPVSLLGDAIAEYMDAAPGTTFFEFTGGETTRASVRGAFEREGLTYLRSGKISGGALTGPSKSLAERLDQDGAEALEQEYGRAYAAVDSDPDTAVAAACAILESMCKTYLTSEGQALPTSQTLGPLWRETAKWLGLSPAHVEDDDLKAILGGLFAIAHGVGKLRTHASSAHGRSEQERKRYRLTPRHARLAIHAAHTMALFTLETRDHRRQASDVTNSNGR